MNWPTKVGHQIQLKGVRFMSKHSAQFKLEVVDDYLRVGSYQRVAKTHGIQTTDVRKWVLAYRHHGSASLYQRVYQQYPPAFKVEVLEYMRTNGLSPRFAAAHFNIASSSTILVWRRLYNKGGITALQSKTKGHSPMSKQSEIQALLAKPSEQLTHEELLLKSHYLEVENAYLKKLEALALQKRLASKSKSK